ncbi:uncharacterized protein KY384_006337 [Bacidia gigantensis]|uniref:uncharacterized protein n=1 Tax=Bacidia gigantensis TaxID=2732470 RepID=UPI001D03A07F|nr:uncharacterized protein KY384_006337 [Bacidia gigantensis]KAG8528650.1 hypothetical protein KY384_006337 [Bacidia gigantensis]
MGDTAVVTGVRGEVLLASSVASAKPLGGDEGGGGERSGRGEKRKRGDKQGREELMELGLLVPNIELNTGCSPDYLPGGPPSGAAQVLSQRLLTGLHVTDLVDIDDLRIWGASSDIEDEGDREGEGMDIDTEDGGVTLAPGATPEDEKTEGRRKELKAFWTLYIDVLLLSLDHGPQGAFDAIWLSVIAALKDTVFPKAWWDADQEAVLCDPDFEQGTKLVLREDTPVALTCGVFHADRGLGRYAGGQEKGERWLLSDLDAFEEELCAEAMRIPGADPHMADRKALQNTALRLLANKMGGGLERTTQASAYNHEAHGKSA